MPVKTPRSAVVALALGLTAVTASLAGVLTGLRIVQADLGAAPGARSVAFAQVPRTQVAVLDKTSGTTNDTVSPLPGATPAARGALPWVRPVRPAKLSAASSLRAELITDGEFSGALFAVLLLPIFWYALFTRRRGITATPKMRPRRQRTRPAFAGGGDRGPSSAELMQVLAAPVVEAADEAPASGPFPSSRPVPAGSAARLPRAEPPHASEVGGRTTLRRVTVSGSPPWDPAPEPTTEFPWAAAPERRSALPRTVMPERHDRYRHAPPVSSFPAASQDSSDLPAGPRSRTGLAPASETTLVAAPVTTMGQGTSAR